MWLYKLWQRFSGSVQPTRGTRRPALQGRVRLKLEQLEDRTVPANFTAATVPELIADINAANLLGGANTITLAARTTFTLTAASSPTAGLPTIAANNDLTILGNGDIIERNSAAAPFRLLDVAAGATLMLKNLTLQGGNSIEGTGGAIHNAGTLTLDATTVQNNSAAAGGVASSGSLTLNSVTVQNNSAYGIRVFDYEYSSYIFRSPALGGGIYSSGALIMSGGNIRNNQAISGGYSFDWQDPPPSIGSGYVSYGHDSVGFVACGGGLYVAGGTATLTGVAITGNKAQGAAGGYWAEGSTYYSSIAGSNSSSDYFYASGYRGLDGCGGGVYVKNGTVTLSGVTLAANSALGGAGGFYSHKYPAGNGGDGLGGGLFGAGGTVTLLNSTVTANVGRGGLAGKGHPNGKPGAGIGGGLYIDSAALVYLDAFTVANNKKNQANSSNEIFGAWLPY